MRIFKGQVWTLHRCLGSCTFQSGKTWSRAAGRNSLRLSQPSSHCILLYGRSLEVKDASWCSHLKGREGYRKQEKKIRWLGGQNIPARTRVSESRINESASRELIHSVLIHEVASQARLRASLTKPWGELTPWGISVDWLASLRQWPYSVSLHTLLGSS